MVNDEFLFSLFIAHQWLVESTQLLAQFIVTLQVIFSFCIVQMRGKKAATYTKREVSVKSCWASYFALYLYGLVVIIA